MLYGDMVLRNANSDRYRRNNHITKANVLHTGICHQAIFARKSLFDNAGKFNTDFKIYADFDWVIRVFRNNHNKKYLNSFHFVVQKYECLLDQARCLA
jgi:hypothetical protein